ncbi:MAG: DUF6873 family GME fold protein [Emergencia sp.]
MSRIYISENANRILTDYLAGCGHTLEFISSSGIVDPALSTHPDIFLCKMGIGENAPVYFAEEKDLSMDYPGDCAFNAACTGKYFIHNLSATSGRLLQAAEEAGMILINVRQGYTKCSTVIVDENSIITYDEGIARACSPYPDLQVLLISPGFIRLDGYDTGFIGGCSGRIGDEIIFNGDLFAHPDFSRIRRFIESRGLTCRWFADYRLTDIGSIL